ncbi:MAG: hypothetical protein IKK63_09230 [Clostridia bacterium]|nr:hypothetical protein [Clostridia bacterium]MBR3819378.1 hypothetical protein [Clostridia bacterium]
MSKILGSWSAMRKYLEQEMLADSLKGRIAYSCTSYPNMDDCKVFEIRVDGKTYKRFSMETVAFKDKNIEKETAWKIYWQEKGNVSVESKTEFDDEEFCEALKIYRELPIEKSIVHENPLVRMFAVFDRRIGKRTIKKLSETTEKQPIWLRELYMLRVNAEKISDRK